MFICELCGNTVAHVNHADVCKSCASMTFTAVKQEVAKKSVEDKDNQDFMLAYFNISPDQFEAVTHENLSDIVDSEFAGFYKNDAKRVLWHEYREKAFTKKGTMKKAVEKKILATIEAQEVQEVEVVATEEVVLVEATQEAKAAPKKVMRNEREQYALNKAAEYRATAKLLGAQALTGSPKQKIWAEKLRKAFIEKTESEDVLYAVINNKKAQTSDFWIKLRDCNYEDIAKVLFGKIGFDRFMVQVMAVRYAKDAVDRWGKDNDMVKIRMRDIKNRFGVEL